MNRADWDESGTSWNHPEFSGAADQRREARKSVIGDILWSCVEQSEIYYKGTIINESESGLCLLTLVPISVGSILRIFDEGRASIRDATVIWCRKGTANIYKSGLVLSE